MQGGPGPDGRRLGETRARRDTAGVLCILNGMNRDQRVQTTNLLLQGKSPSEIARELRIPLGVILNQLYRAVGQGLLRRSDILFSIDPHVRQAVETAISAIGGSETRRLRRELAKSGVQVSREDLDVYLRLRDSRVDLGDMYEFVREIELRLHDYIRTSLIAEYGEENWWRKGVPLPVREDCAVMNERDAEPVSSLYCYTTLMNLRFILDREWHVLSKNLPGGLRADKQQFLADLSRLNRIRNIVMHPVKGIMFTGDDFDFVRRLRRQLLQAGDNAHSAAGVQPADACAQAIVEAHTAGESQPRTAA